ncbi:MAG: type I pullulanase [Firmicutes bacterium]|nr:type I pullulanase [Bacillota bacterium]
MSHPHFDSLEFYQRYHYHGELGAIYHRDHTLFRLWAPTARQVWLVTYSDGLTGSGVELAMEPDINGTWITELPGDHHGLYYTYKVLVNGDINEAVDPYAKACGVNGYRGMVVDLERTNPPGWDKLARPPLTRFVDAIIYELHVRDISIHPLSGIALRGKYLGLTEQNTRGPHNVKTGLSHLVELGITHVQLMPCSDFATIDESNKEPLEYNWGYDPLNYSIPEGSYSTDAFDGTRRIVEYKEMIKTLKEASIRVNMDVVYNHTFYSHASHLNKIVPSYYYRQDRQGRFSNGSGCGNELASERSMVRKMIVDSVRYWAEEYKIDGFRFDLMGLLDIPTINEIRSTLNAVDRSIMMYGEGWTGGHSPLLDELKALKTNVRQLPGTGAFNDDLRDGIRGHVFHADQPGFVNGGVGLEETVEFGIVGSCEHDQIDYNQVVYSRWPWAGEPAQSINYVEVHDNLTLWDKLQAVDPDQSESVLMDMHKMCGALILTSQGIPLLHAGMEFLRTKYGDYNSYRSPDSINQIDWERKYRYLPIFHYYQGLITLRKCHPAFRMVTAAQIQRHLRFLPVPDSHMIAYILRENANDDSWKNIVVIFNAKATSKEMELPEEDWVVVVDKHRAGIIMLDQIEGQRVIVPPRTSLVLVDAESYHGA